LDREAEESVPRVEREIYERTGISSTSSRQKIRIEVNSSDYTTEEVLLIEYEDGRWRPVSYLSKSLNETERNYEIYDKEILVIIRKLEN